MHRLPLELESVHLQHLVAGAKLPGPAAKTEEDVFRILSSIRSSVCVAKQTLHFPPCSPLSPLRRSPLDDPPYDDPLALVPHRRPLEDEGRVFTNYFRCT